MRRVTAIWLIAFVIGSPQARTEGILSPGASPQKRLSRGVGEGPAFHPELGVLFSGGGHIGRMARDGAQSIYRKDAGTNGLLFDRQGRLLCCEPVRRRVSRIETDGKLAVLATQFDGKKFNQPNDITIDTRGHIFFTDPQYGDRSRMEMTDAAGNKVEGVYRIDVNGRVSRVITHEVDRPNGIVVTPDDKYLYVADNNNNEVGGARKLWRFNLRTDATVDLKSRKLLFDWKTGRGPDGMVLDQQGRIFVAGGLNKPHPPAETADEFKGGVYVLSPEGKLLDFIAIPHDEVTNCAFGDDDLKTLYITAGGTLWSVRVQTPGRIPWPPAR